MVQKLKVELQDENGNIYYLHTAADVVFLDDGTTVEAALEKKVTASGGDISNTKLATLAASSASFPVPEAGDAPKTLWGKAKKWQQDCLAKFANYVLTSAITNQYLNDTSKIPTAALMYLLKQEVNGLNSNAVRRIPSASVFPDLTSLMEYTEDWNVPFMFGLDWTSALSPDGSTTIGIMTRNGAWAFTHSGNVFYANALDSSPNEWKSINKGIFTSRNSISNNADMNEIKTPGLYSLNGATGLTHIPTDLAYGGSIWYGLVFVFKRSDGAIMQLVIATGTDIQYGIGYRNTSSNLWCLTNVTWMES